MRKVLALRLSGDEKHLLELAASERGVALSTFVRTVALEAAGVAFETVENERAPDAEQVEELPARPSLVRRVLRSADIDGDARAPAQRNRRPWRDTGVSAADAHRHSNREPSPYEPLSSWNPPGWPGGYGEGSRPPAGPPSD